MLKKAYPCPTKDPAQKMRKVEGWTEKNLVATDIPESQTNNPISRGTVITRHTIISRKQKNNVILIS